MIGFFNVIKPAGVSSGYVVNRIKHITKEKVGHLGTLDPLASGVLPIAVGKATRLFDYFLKKDKTYFALARFGVLTNTLDGEGKIIAKDDVKITLKQVQKEAEKLIGETLQKPPLFSARQKDGVRGYEAAVIGKQIELEPKKVQIYSIFVKKWHQNNVFLLKIHCSAGTYVRSIIRDIGVSIGTVATTVAIVRTQSGAFTLNEAVTIEDIEKDAINHLIKINDVLKLPAIELKDFQAKALEEGKSIKITFAEGDYLTYLNGKEFSLAQVKEGQLKNKIYFYDKEK